MPIEVKKLRNVDSLSAGIYNVPSAILGVFFRNNISLSLMFVSAAGRGLSALGFGRGANGFLGYGGSRQGLNLWQGLGNVLRRGVRRGNGGYWYGAYLHGNAFRFYSKRTGATIPQLLHKRNEESVNSSVVYYILDTFEISRCFAVCMQKEGGRTCPI